MRRAFHFQLPASGKEKPPTIKNVPPGNTEGRTEIQLRKASYGKRKQENLCQSNMTSFEHQKNSAPHHLLEALTPVSYTYGFIDFCWTKSTNTFNIQNINWHVSWNNNPRQILQWNSSQHLRTLQASNVFSHLRKKLKWSKIMKKKFFFNFLCRVFLVSIKQGLTPAGTSHLLEIYPLNTSLCALLSYKGTCEKARKYRSAYVDV